MANFAFTSGLLKDEEIIQGKSHEGKEITVRRLYRGFKGNKIKYNFEILIDGVRSTVLDQRAAKLEVENLLGTPTSGLPKPETDSETAQEIAPEIYTIVELAAALGKSEQTVRRLLRQLGIPKKEGLPAPGQYLWNKKEYNNVFSLIQKSLQD